MTAYEIIIKKRNGDHLRPDEINHFIQEYLHNRIPDYQMSAFLMAVYFQGMDEGETKALIDSFLQSGKKISLQDIPGIKVGKHSTGGVGDKVSIILASIVAAAGVPVPMISGRGLGHTGGTLDKLSSIPGFRIDLDELKFRTIISEVGTCLIGQTADLVPADRRIYALRDVTGTIESHPLIAASILSKKLAEGSNALVLDIKCGNGAFMQSLSDAENLARVLINNGKRSGLQTVAYITNMDHPIGRAIGNWLEIRECIDCLRGEEIEDLMHITHQLAGTMICLGGKSDTIDEGVAISRDMITSGKAWLKFRNIVQAQGGEIRIIEHPETYPHSEYTLDINAESSGWVKSIGAREVGLSLIQLGGGRKKTDDEIDPKAGIVLHKKPGDPVKKGEKLFTLYTDAKKSIQPVSSRIKSVIQIVAGECAAPKLIYKFLQ
jgi:pyrimidine-nucleoside phosphorylase